MTAQNRRPFPAIPDAIQKIHIIGIAGTAMGSLAAMLKSKGFDVKGSDKMAYPPMSTWLEDQGIDIMIGYDEKNLDWNPDLVVVGNVCRSTYADAVAMRERGIAHLSFPEALCHFFMRKGNNVVVTGTHGKTTTTSLIAWSLFHANCDPSFFVGGITGNFDSNFRLGSDLFVVEGDEYDTAYFDKVPKFWHYSPYRATINNIEFDHADIYPDLDAVKHVFQRMVQLIPEDGTLWVNGDDANALEVSEKRDCVRCTFGLGENNNLRATNINYGGEVITCDVSFMDKDLGQFELPMVGEFNVRNMLGAIGICLDEGIDLEIVKEGFKKFKSVKKRQELIAEVKGIKIFDDFAHHPTAVEATLAAMRKRFPDNKIWGIFEAKSNTSRRAVFQNDYPRALSLADHVIISKPWGKDDLPPEKLLSISKLVDDIKSTNTPIELIENVDDIAAYVAKNAKTGDIVVGLSGSSFGGLHQKIVDALSVTI